MKLHEIIKVGQQSKPGFVIDDFELINPQPIGTAENIPIHVLRNKHDHDLIAYVLHDRGSFVSYVVGKYGSLDGPAFFISRTWTIPSERNRGLMTSLYKALYTKYHIRLVGDIEQSPETISVWKKLIDELPVKVFDLSNKEIKDIKDISDEDLYDKKRGLRLVLEEVIPDPSFAIIPERPKCLDDYYHYTHISNRGKYI